MSEATQSKDEKEYALRQCWGRLIAIVSTLLLDVVRAGGVIPTPLRSAYLKSSEVHWWCI